MDKGLKNLINYLIGNPFAAVISTNEGIFSTKPKWFFLERYNDAFIAEAQAFTDSVLNDAPTLVTGKDGLMPVLIAKAAQKSFEEGRTVKLTEIE